MKIFQKVTNTNQKHEISIKGQWPKYVTGKLNCDNQELEIANA